MNGGQANNTGIDVEVKAQQNGQRQTLLTAMQRQQSEYCERGNAGTTDSLSHKSMDPEFDALQESGDPPHESLACITYEQDRWQLPKWVADDRTYLHSQSLLITPPKRNKRAVD